MSFMANCGPPARPSYELLRMAKTLSDPLLKEPGIRDGVYLRSVVPIARATNLHREPSPIPRQGHDRMGRGKK